MKKWLSYGAVFIATYLVFVLISLPANFLIAKLTLPKNLDLQRISGSIWHAKIAQVNINQGRGQSQRLELVEVSLSPWSLLLADPSFKVNFGGALVAGPEGSLTVSGLLDKMTIDDADILLSANAVMGQVANKLSLPVDVTATGDIAIKFEQLVLDKPVCQLAKGQLFWHKASISALDQTVALGPLAADISCEKGALALKVRPKNNLGLSFSAYLAQNGHLSGNGYLTPGNDFPAALQALLPFLGNGDQQGRYRLKF
jgi:general secretion pathway protein N